VDNPEEYWRHATIWEALPSPFPSSVCCNSVSGLLENPPAVHLAGLLPRCSFDFSARLVRDSPSLRSAWRRFSF
jgi:hypothetical protein